MNQDRRIIPVVPEQYCEYCDSALLEGCNEYGSIFEEDGSVEHACPNNPNQFGKRDNLDQSGRIE
jgi:hypothetical protein